MLEFKDATIKVGEQVLAEQLSFIARDGKLTCITGRDGSGKTVLLRTLMGFLPVSDGFVSVDGELLTTRSAHVFREMIAYLPQDLRQLRHQLQEPEEMEPEPEEYAVWNALLPSVTSPEQPASLSPEEIFLLEKKTLQEAKDKPIVIADEPTAYLTPELTCQMLELLRYQADAGKTVLVVSQKAQVLDVADLVIDLDRI